MTQAAQVAHSFAPKDAQAAAPRNDLLRYVAAPSVLHYGPHLLEPGWVGWVATGSASQQTQLRALPRLKHCCAGARSQVPMLVALITKFLGGEDMKIL